jgi:hypothetical protein
MVYPINLYNINFKYSLGFIVSVENLETLIIGRMKYFLF